MASLVRRGPSLARRVARELQPGAVIISSKRARCPGALRWVRQQM